MPKQNEVTETVTTNSEDNSGKKVEKFFLTEESFELLRSAQKRINEVTELTPSLRKMINELVSKETVDKLVERFIECLK